MQLPVLRKEATLNAPEDNRPRPGMTLGEAAKILADAEEKRTGVRPKNVDYWAAMRLCYPQRKIVEVPAYPSWFPKRTDF